MKNLLRIPFLLLFAIIANGLYGQCEALFTFDETDITIQFTDLSTSAPGDPIVSWFWDFEDGTTSSQQNPLHTFPEPGVYDITLIITTTNGCTAEIVIRIETCAFTVSISQDQCDASGNITLTITVNDIYDNAKDIDILVDGQVIPGSPFEIDAENPVTVNYDIPGDGLSHTLDIQSTDIETCSKSLDFTVEDCSSNCFLSSLAVNITGGTTYTVNVGDDFFSPENTTIEIGDLVHFNWIGSGHSTTSDATSGDDSWNSGVIGAGSTYDVNIKNPGVHPYYCLPHGGPGGAGMSGTIIANCPTGNNFTLDITFNTTIADPQGFNLYKDGILDGGSPYNYNGIGAQSVQATIAGDGLPHVIEIEDVADPTCIIAKNWTAPDCGSAPQCDLSVEAVENGACDPSDNVPVELTVTAINPGNSGFNILVDGVPDPGNPFIYGGGGTTIVTISVAGDGQSHTISVTDVDDPACTGSTAIITTNCTIPCSISNLIASTGNSAMHVVLVEDFVFNPANITIADGDIIEWQWIGAIDHTSTSDAGSGPDSWDSGLLGTGSVYQSPVLSTGIHPYYCIPHGAPGGVGMSGTVTVQANCTNGMVSVNITFNETGGSFNGFDVLVDGASVGSFNYDASGTTTVSVNVTGDGLSHSIEIVDADDPSCTASTSITTPDCNAPTCALTVTATENGGCDANDNVPVDLTVSDVGGGASGFEVLVDAVSVGTYAYDASGTTTITIDVIGDGQGHTIEAIDVDDNTCSASTNITTSNCTIPCSISNLNASTGSSTTHVVLVEDFVFSPANITISDGDIVEWQWTGAIDHTSTSDAGTGPDSWDSGLLGTGSVYQSPVLSTGIHPYYCIPHGAPGGVGMSGTITVQANCTNGQVSVNITFNETGGSFNGFDVLVDNVNVGTYNYDPSGTTTISVNVTGDGLSHTIEIVDADDPGCTASTNITTPDCNAPTCQLTMTATENGSCDVNDNVPVDLTVSDVGGGANGFEVFVDAVSVGTYSYDASGTTSITIDIIGDGQSHTIEVIDLDDNTCSASTNITTSNCTIPCSISNLNASTGSSTTHVVLVEDFVFSPANITISDGDIVEWQWTGAIDHTSTSDAGTGPDSWDSGLLGSGLVYQSPVLSTGIHPYYCIPHGAPGGVGMSGTITVQANCTNGQVSVNITFDETGGSFNGFEVLVDGASVGSFNYDASGATTVSVNVTGDGLSHTIEIIDADDPSCTASTSIITPDCNAPTCQLTMTAVENGGCDVNDNVPVDLTVSDVGGGVNGFEVLVDGASAGTYAYDASGTTNITIDVSGDGQSHTIEVIDLDDNTCSASTNITTSNCTIPCSISNLNASTGSSTTHVVLVEDFVFNPANITIADGDIVEWQWTGAIDHTSTSDAGSGPDSWDSGLLGTGSVYQSPVLSTGIHPYYCIPHGAPGGVGMSGTVTVQANCTNGQVSVNITFDETGGSFNGFDVLVDGAGVGSFNYDASGATTVSVNVTGDGLSHTIEIIDADDPSCTASTSIITPDCNAPTCQLTMTAVENGGCDVNDNVPVDLTVSDVGGGVNGFEVFVDALSVGTYAYDASGTTNITINVIGDGQMHTIEVKDVDDNTCSATTNITTSNCTIPCSISNLNASTGSSTTHVVLVEDFVFSPANITISDGDIVEWQWTGAIDHTSTSDAGTGPDSWDSGLLGTGSSFQSPVLSTGIHPYYCIPHGAPGGVGMSGTITVQANCTNGQVSVNITFNETGGSFNGFDVLVDNVNVGTYNYDPSGTTTISVNVTGDGLSHTIEIVDADDPSCTASTSITTPDCNAPTCALTLTATENGGCDVNDNVPVDLTVSDVGGGANGFEVLVDAVSVGTYAYDASGTTGITIDVTGDGQGHTIEVMDVDDNTCSASTNITTSNCTIPCSISNLNASTGSSTTHVVLVEDFVFSPANITISDGDIVEWQWTGAIDHTSTSDAGTGPDSWDSGLLGTGSVYQSPVLSTGIHPYYCIPHGAPGGVGMSGTITVQANCTNGQVSVNITFNETGGSFNGFDVLVDNVNVGTYNYDPSGTTTISVNVTGDGLSHTIEIVDADDPGCTASTSITTPDCNAPTCALTVTATENGGCDANDNVPVDLTVSDVGGGASGFEVLVDAVSVGTYAYDASGTTGITIDVTGDGQGHTIEVMDVDDNTCSASTNITTSNCTIPCSISNLNASTGSSTTHVVLVEDFVFNPANITIADGDIIEWQWTGAIDHTSTSDAGTGPDSWDSGLLGTGSVYQSPVLSTGIHPYYCIPHGAPGGVGMSGTITVQANCTNGQVSVNITFNETGGSFNGFDVLVDNVNVGTYNYDPSGTTTISVNVTGDGLSHTIEIVDADDPSCTASTSITTPDCNAPTCALTVTATENGGCDANDNVPVDLTVSDVGGGASGFEVLVDAVSVGTYAYDASGTTGITIDVTGDGQGHTIEVMDVDDNTCSASTNITTSNCTIPCSISNLNASTGSSTTHVVLVEDFVFNPANITIADGDIIEWQWTGAIDHTSTSDAGTGPDSWDSGLLGTGSVYQSPVLSTGIHPYYCIPHGAPGGVGMSGTITVQANCTNGQVSVNITFNETGGSFNGFDVLVDNVNVGTYNYDPSGTTTISVNVTGDGLSHTIEIVDADDPGCTASTSITTPDCNAPTCALTVTATENGGCDANDNVPVDLTVSDVGGGASGFEVLVDAVSVGTYAYDASGTTGITIDVTGDGQPHTIEVMDVDDNTCSASTNITTSNCTIPCSISNLNASTGSSTTHVVLVEDFVFNPANITIADGDIIEWQWTGAIDHTSTSDAGTGPDSWDSGLLGTGSVYQSPVLSTGIHPYYCIPHGAPGGVGMSGTITVQANCTNGQVSVNITFNETGGSFNGFDVLVDNVNVGTYNYDPSGTTTISVNVTGDGQSHTIEIVDADDPGCTASTSITTPDCNAPTCALTVTATENGGCDANDNVPVDLTVSDVGGGASGFEVFVDAVSVGTYAYDASGTTGITINVIGDGQSHTIEAIDVDDNTCSATVDVITSDCTANCLLSNFNLNNITSGNPATHTVEVKDFEFSPKDITINIGDVVHFDWTGVIPHTTTSDIMTGPDSWNSDLLGQGATFDVTIQNEGFHPYYCIPHGAPGGIGMAGTITAVPPCNNGQVAVEITFDEANGSFNGYNVLVDGNVYPGSPFNYSPSGMNTLVINLAGDGQLHSISIEDLDDPSCTLGGSIEVTNCNVQEPCTIAVSATQVGGCDTNNQVEYELSIDAQNTGAAFNILVDGNVYPGSPFLYNNTNPTNQNIFISGTGLNRLIEIQDVDSTMCIANVEVATPLCGPVCEILNLNISQQTRHLIEVKDFEFVPAIIDVLVGDTVEFFWTGVIPHTTTSDNTSGPDSWDSGLLGQGETFEIIMQEAGTHPYYCIPHGGPGGIGMAGVINAVENCDNGMATVALSFETTNGSPLGYNIFLDGSFLTGPVLYDNQMGQNTTLINVPGDDSNHLIAVQDMDIGFCAATTSFITPYCEVLCEIQDLLAVTGENIVQVIHVKDFEFEPLEVTTRTGEAVRFVWTGDIPHTATSDALTGSDAWDSGLLSQGDEYGRIMNTEGDHPYYCIPHGGPGGIGMAGMIHTLQNCENGEVAVEISFSVTSGSAGGYNVFVDGSPVPDNPIPYDDPTGLNTYMFNVPGDGQVHLISVQDLEVTFCAATTQVEVIDCDAICNISNASTGLQESTTHIVEVKDFEFSPKDISINLGDTVRFIWTGQIPHTTTSDVQSGVDAWDSDLLGEGAVYDLIITTEGFHPYYCIPHGGPGGIGMAGSITVLDNDCNNGLVNVDLSFNHEVGSPLGFNILIDGNLDLNGPYLYDGSGTNNIQVEVPGDGATHEIMIQDVEDSNCTEVVQITTANCSTACNLSATVIQQGSCDANNLIAYELTVISQNAGSAFAVDVDGSPIPGSPFTYSANDTTFITFDIPGDGLLHLIEIADADSTNCATTIEIMTEDCTPDCLLSLAANQTGACDMDGNVSYDIIVEATNQGANGFDLYLDGAVIGGSPFAYAGSSTIVSIDIFGDGSNHQIVVIDQNITSCNDTISFDVPDCLAACAITEISHEVGVPLVYEVEVQDFVFAPVLLNVEVGDTIRWIWTGVIPHTVTSDTLSGDDSWNSGLLGEGSVFEIVIQNAGFHPYYCIPHGAPGGIGMAGSITAADPGDDDLLNVGFTFSNINTGFTGYNVLLDGIEIPENPFSYSGTGTNSFITEVPCDGQMHDLSVSDIDDPECGMDIQFQMPDCNDPCYNFEAGYTFEINHQTLQVDFTNETTGATEWLWTFGDGGASVVENPVYTYTESGTYDVCLQVENVDGCIDTICESIVVGAYQCEAAFDFENTGLTVDFFDQSITSETITNWEWSYGNGFTQEGIQNPVYTYDSLGIYEVCLTIEAGNCLSDTCMVLDLSNPCLAFEAAYTFTIDEDNNSVQFTDLTQGNPNQWLWGFGDGNTSNEQNPEYFYDGPGAYNVCLLVQDNNLACNSSYCQTVFINVTSVGEPGRNKQLTIYPNPSSSTDLNLTVKGILEKDFNKPLPIKLYDLGGRTIVQKTVNGAELISLDLDQRLTRSIYFLEIKGRDTVYRGKIIVQ